MSSSDYEYDGRGLAREELNPILGALLDSNGTIQSELNRGLGFAASEFKALSKLWNHTNLTIAWKHRIFQTCVVSKLLYGLQTAVFTKKQTRQLDGFHARCLRKILRIAPPYWSRVSNYEVLSRMQARPLSQQLLKQQLNLFAKIYRRPNTDIGRSLVFEPSSDTLLIHSLSRRRGRPRLDWATEIWKHAVRMNSGAMSIGRLMGDARQWKESAELYCNAASS